MQNERVHTLFYQHLGLVPYERGLLIQQEFHQKVKTGAIDAIVLSLEHPNTLTLGKHANTKYLLADFNQLNDRGVSLCQTDRGGEVTAHMPGQLVIYPILPISLLGLSPKAYVNLLCESVIESMGHYGICSHKDDEFPGVWVGDQKICAIGVRISSRVSMHGLALNVDNSLELFSSIVPCGISGKGVTNMKNLLAFPPNIQDVCDLLIKTIGRKLGLKVNGDFGK